MSKYPSLNISPPLAFGVNLKRVFQQVGIILEFVKKIQIYVKINPALLKIEISKNPTDKIFLFIFRNFCQLDLKKYIFKGAGFILTPNL